MADRFDAGVPLGDTIDKGMIALPIARVAPSLGSKRRQPSHAGTAKLGHIKKWVATSRQDGLRDAEPEPRVFVLPHPHPHARPVPG